MAKILLNKINITNKVTGAITQKRFQGLAYNAANTRFLAAKTNALESFDDNEITKELLVGAESTESILSYGNLASFLGFDNSSEDVAQLRDKLKLGIVMNKTPVFRKGKNNVVYEFKVKAPSLQEIYDSTPMPYDWSSKSWVKAIEEGIGTFSYYVFRLAGLPGSHSGTGLQRKGQRKWMSVKDTVLKIPYISEILKEFKSYFVSK